MGREVQQGVEEAIRSPDGRCSVEVRWTMSWVKVGVGLEPRLEMGSGRSGTSDVTVDRDAMRCDVM